MQKEDFIREVMVHKNKMYRFALSYMRDADEASDAVQDVLLRLWETRQQLSEVRSLEAWCMTLVRNKCLDRLKRVERKLKVYQDDASPAVHPTSKTATPLEVLEEKEKGTLIHDAVEALPEKQKAVFHLRDVQGYSYLEICDLLELDMNNVKVNIFRARKALKEALTQSRET